MSTTKIAQDKSMNFDNNCEKLAYTYIHKEVTILAPNNLRMITDTKV